MDIKVIKFERSRDGFSKVFSDAIVILGRREKHLVPPQEGNLLVEYTGELPAGSSRRRKIIFARALATVRGEAEKVVEKIRGDQSLLDSIIENGGDKYESSSGLLFWVSPCFAWQDENIQAEYGETAVKVTLRVVYSPKGEEVSGYIPRDPEVREVIFKGKGCSLIASARERNKLEQEKKNKEAGFKQAFLSEHPEMTEALAGVDDFYSCMLRVRKAGFGQTFPRAFYDGHAGVEWNEFSITVGGQEYKTDISGSHVTEKEKDYL